MNWKKDLHKELADATELVWEMQNTLSESEDYRCLPEITAYSELLLHRVLVISGHVSRWKLWSESNDLDRKHHGSE